MQGASLQAASGGGPSAAETSGVLERMGSDLFGLVEGNSEATQDAARYVAYFSATARSWVAANQRERARGCLERAMRYSQQLEALVAGDMVAVERKEGYVVALFNLYLEGAKSAAGNKQQVGHACQHPVARMVSVPARHPTHARACCLGCGC